MTKDMIDFWTMMATWVGSGANIVVAVIAGFAANTWRKGLQQQRADEAIEAVNDCAAALGRAVGSKIRSQPLAPGKYFQDEAWASWSRFRTRYAVVHRYFPAAPDGLVDDGVAIMNRLSDFCAATSVLAADGEHINQDFGKLRARVEQLMG